MPWFLSPFPTSYRLFGRLYCRDFCQLLCRVLCRDFCRLFCRRFLSSEAIRLVRKSYSLTCSRFEGKYNKNDKGSHFGLDLNNSRSKTRQNSRHKSRQKDLTKKSAKKSTKISTKKSAKKWKEERNHGTYWALYTNMAIPHL